MARAQQKCELVSRTPRMVTVRTEDGVERRFNGKNIIMVYCRKPDLDEQIKKTPNRQIEVRGIIDNETLLLFGSANWI